MTIGIIKHQYVQSVYEINININDYSLTSTKEKTNESANKKHDIINYCFPSGKEGVNSVSS